MACHRHGIEPLGTDESSPLLIDDTEAMELCEARVARRALPQSACPATHQQPRQMLTTTTTALLRRRETLKANRVLLSCCVSFSSACLLTPVRSRWPICLCSPALRLCPRRPFSLPRSQSRAHLLSLHLTDITCSGTFNSHGDGSIVFATYPVMSSKFNMLSIGSLLSTS